MHKRGAERTSQRVSVAAAGGGDWVGELRGLAGNSGLGWLVGGGGDRPNTDGTSGNDRQSSDSRSAAGSHGNPLVLAGLSPDSVRSFVLSNDPVPRMWLAADPLFTAAAANETVANILGARERFFGAGIFSPRRFLYEAVGVLYWMQWSAKDGTKISVHRGEGSALVDKLALDPPWAGDSWMTESPLRAIQGSLDHNAQNYMDSVAYVALKRLGHSTSKAL